MLIPRTLTRLSRQALQIQSVRCMGAPGLGDVLSNPSFEQRVIDSGASMDNLPSPEGDFLTEYNKRQSKFNKHLLGAIAFAIGTTIFGYQYNSFDWGIVRDELPAINIYDHIPENDDEADKELTQEINKMLQDYANKA